MSSDQDQLFAVNVPNSPTKPTQPVDCEVEFQDVKRKKKTKKSKEKSLQTSKSNSDSMNTVTPPILLSGPQLSFQLFILND